MEDETVTGPTVVCSCFVEKDGRFLILLCPRFRVWRVPGGRAEWHETLEETLTREMEEETGIPLKDPVFLGYGQGHQYHYRKKRKTSRLLMFFHARAEGEVRIDPDEALDSKWVTLDELKSLEKKEGALDDFFRKHPDLRI